MELDQGKILSWFNPFLCFSSALAVDCTMHVSVTHKTRNLSYPVTLNFDFFLPDCCTKLQKEKRWTNIAVRRRAWNHSTIKAGDKKYERRSNQISCRLVSKTKNTWEKDAWQNAGSWSLVFLSRSQGF